MFQIEKPGLPLYAWKSHANGFRASHEITSLNSVPRSTQFQGEQNCRTPLQKAQDALYAVEADIRKRYTTKERLKAGWTALKDDLKKSKLVQAGLMSGVFIPVSLMMPHLTIFLLPVPLFLFMLAVTFTGIRAHQAYEDPEILLTQPYKKG